MAALIEGQQYGLSAQDKINSNKSIVFVKLTDSALRSIEEYVKNKGGAGNKPTIQFQNSNGILSLPHNGTTLTYGFSLANIEADGPQGSFECLRQSGQRSLDSLGCMHLKMHIHANEDSYENTRVKMAAVEKEKNKSCTKVIKPAGAHLGRKVKVKRPGLIVNPVKPHHSPPSSTMLNKNPIKLTNGMSNGSSNNSNNSPSIPPKKLPEMNRFQKAPQPKKTFTSSPELLRQPIRDRIIHILAIRPYKRPELIVRLMSEGIRDKDRKGIGAILSQVGLLKGNVYNLANYCWNEVQDNWKFVTQDELDIIRRRKQQVLSNAANESPPIPTPPSSSPAQKRLPSETFSVGQEPRAKKQRISHYSRTDNYSSSAKSEPVDSSEKLHLTITNMGRKDTYSPSTNGVEQDEIFNPKSPSSSCDGFSSKKQRVSPYPRTDINQNTKKEPNEKIQFNSTANRTSSYPFITSTMNSSSQNNELSPKSPEDSCDGYPVGNHLEDSQSSSSLNLRNASREDGEKSIRKHTTGLIHAGSKNSEKPFHKAPVKKYEMDESNQKHSKTSVNSEKGKSSLNQTLSHVRDSILEPEAQVSPDSNTPYEGKELKSDSCSKSLVNGYVNSIKSNGYSSSQSSYVHRSKVTSTTNGSCSTSPHSPESCSDSNDSLGANSPDLVHLNLPPTTPESDPELPDYMTKYTKILSYDQRTRYKNDFNAQYQEYLSLHSKIEKIKMKFMSLNNHLRNYEEGSEEYMNISSKIYEQYRAYHEDENYKKSEEKLNYLHTKLSHIKKLVMEYDNSYHCKS
ncbi:RNA polymerase II elongation factor ELL2 [Parasteatoda tepidariorum]|uniref:RNA polymerase II elongation factor ELL2 n=1 Tax=Parasteatoda tepidariorum TaxID=114398 RepID=UPI00077F955E|nr:RNA polymerase II elongation factor ELL [Parasteatoda tepidariorum]